MKDLLTAAQAVIGGIAITALIYWLLNLLNCLCWATRGASSDKKNVELHKAESAPTRAIDSYNSPSFFIISTCERKRN